MRRLDMSEKYKKFGELTRDEQVRLINHSLDGGEVEIYINDGKWHNTDMSRLGFIYFYKDHRYRKLKTELETLKEEYEAIGKKIREIEGSGCNIQIGDIVLRKSDVVPFIVKDSGFKNFPFLVGDTCYTNVSLAEDFIPAYRSTINR